MASKVPYEAELGDRDPLKVIAKTPRRLARLLDGLNDKQIEARPKPGKWNLREVVAHLADCEIVWSWRLRQTYAKDNAVLESFDQDEWAKAYDVYSLAEAIACFKALRKWNVAFIGGLSSKQLKKVVTHSERGQETLGTLVRVMAGHDLHHLKLLEKK